jgi:hypothetical protein
MAHLIMLAPLVLVVNAYSTGNRLAISSYSQLTENRQFLPIHEKHSLLSQLALGRHAVGVGRSIPSA